MADAGVSKSSSSPRNQLRDNKDIERIHYLNSLSAEEAQNIVTFLTHNDIGLCCCTSKEFLQIYSEKIKFMEDYRNFIYRRFKMVLPRKNVRLAQVYSTCPRMAHFGVSVYL